MPRLSAARARQEGNVRRRGRRSPRSRDGRWTGGQFIAVAALLFVASSVLAIVALAMAGGGLSAVADGNASFVALPIAAVLVGIASTAAGVGSVVMLLAGIIRLGVG